MKTDNVPIFNQIQSIPWKYHVKILVLRRQFILKVTLSNTKEKLKIYFLKCSSSFHIYIKQNFVRQLSQNFCINCFSIWLSICWMRGGRQAGHNIFHNSMPQIIFLSSGSHEPQPYGLPCHSIFYVLNDQFRTLKLQFLKMAAYLAPLVGNVKRFV